MRWWHGFKQRWWDDDRGTIFALAVIFGLAGLGAFLLIQKYKGAFDGDFFPVEQVQSDIASAPPLQQQLRLKGITGKELVIEIPSAQLPQGLPSAEDLVSQKRAEWGQLGDFFGGMLNPVLAFLSFLALIGTLLYQKKELKSSQEEVRLTRRAMEQQRFEQTFFSWLDTYRALLDSIEVVTTGSVDKRKELRGRRALHYWWENRLTYQSIEAYKQAGDDQDQRKAIRGRLQMMHGLFLQGTSDEEVKELVDDALREWNRLYSDWEFLLDNYFRILYRFLLWIDSQHPDQLTNAQKWFYVGIVRSQLSWVELVFLFFNGLEDRGQKFRALANKYALFDNLTFQDTVLKTLKEMATEVYTESAYKSHVARAQMQLPETLEETLSMAFWREPGKNRG